MKSIYKILILGISLIIISFIYPVGLGTTTPSKSYLPNETICLDCDVPPDYFMINLLIILLPIIVILAIIVFLYPSKSECNEREI